MILVTHAIVGAALTRRYHAYASIFLISFLSHYVFDMIPHWHYSVPKIKKAVDEGGHSKTLSFQKIFLPDIARIFIDFSFGIALSCYFLGGITWAIGLAAFGAMLPDILVGIARFYPARFLIWHYDFHRFMHTKIFLDDRPLMGIGSQAVVTIIMILIFTLY